MTQTASVAEYFEKLVSKLTALIPQSSYFKEQKNLADDKTLTLIDFIQNYSFKIHDESQGYH